MAEYQVKTAYNIGLAMRLDSTLLFLIFVLIKHYWIPLFLIDFS